jgi:hypothetical protein
MIAPCEVSHRNAIRHAARDASETALRVAPVHPLRHDGDMTAILIRNVSNFSRA